MSVDRTGEVFARIVNREAADALVAATRAGGRSDAIMERLKRDGRALGAAAYELIADPATATPPDTFADDLRSGITAALGLASSGGPWGVPALDRETSLAWLAWLASRGFGGGPEVPDRGRRCRERLGAWKLDDVIAKAFRALGRDAHAARRAAKAVAAIQELRMWRPSGAADAGRIVDEWLGDTGAREALDIRRDAGVERFDPGAYDDLVAWTTWVAAIRLLEYPEAYGRADSTIIEWVGRITAALQAAGAAANARVDRLIEFAGAAHRPRISF